MSDRGVETLCYQDKLRFKEPPLPSAMLEDDRNVADLFTFEFSSVKSTLNLGWGL